VAATPEPLRATEVGVADALLTMEMLPEVAPTDAGRKFAMTVVFCPALTLKGGEYPPTVNAVEPDAVTWVMLKVAVPVLVMIKACDVFVPTGSFPKLMELELT